MQPLSIETIFLPTLPPSVLSIPLIFLSNHIATMKLTLSILAFLTHTLCSAHPASQETVVAEENDIGRSDNHSRDLKSQYLHPANVEERSEQHLHSSLSLGLQP